jgi:hypothetical protein
MNTQGPVGAGGAIGCNIGGDSGWVVGAAVACDSALA